MNIICIEDFSRFNPRVGKIRWYKEGETYEKIDFNRSKEEARRIQSKTITLIPDCLAIWNKEEV